MGDDAQGQPRMSDAKPWLVVEERGVRACEGDTGLLVPELVSRSRSSGIRPTLSRRGRRLNRLDPGLSGRLVSDWGKILLMSFKRRVLSALGKDPRWFNTDYIEPPPVGS